MRAMVTGASRGIGAAVALALAKAGHDLIVNYRSDEAGAHRVKDAAEALGVRVELARFDVRDHERSSEAIERLLRAEDPIGILVNNAGVVADAPFPIMRHADWSNVVGTTLDGFFNVTQKLVMPMVRRRWGRIVNIASVSGLIGNRGQVNYAAAKAGLIGATKALAQEVAKRGVTVNAVAPGIIDTDMTADLPPEIVKLVPMRRSGRVEEVSETVAFLASDGASYITGQVVTVSGGLG